MNAIVRLLFRTMPENFSFPPWRPDRLYYAFNYDYTKKQGKEPLNSDEKETGNEFNINDTGSLDSDDEEKVEDVQYAMKGVKGSWCLENIQRVGMENIPTEKEKEEKPPTDAAKNPNELINQVLTPSDHYGLIAEFECVGMSHQEVQQSVGDAAQNKRKSCVVL